MKQKARFFRIAILVVVVLIALGWLASSIYPDWLWFQSLDFSSVFLTMLFSKILIGLAVAVVFALAVGINYYVARFIVNKRGPMLKGTGGLSVEGLPISERAVGRVIGVFLVIVALMIGNAASSKWSMILMYLHPKSFGITDPIFGLDVAFYVFSLPFFLFLKTWLMAFVVFSGMVALLMYSRGNLIHMEVAGLQAQERDVRPAAKLTIDPLVTKHLSVLAMILVALIIGGYWLKVYELMYSTKGPAFGASYTDIHVQLVVYRVLMIVLGAFGFCRERALFSSGWQ
jgi:uncharacterized membrane protein (UPF0182 family)